MNLAYEEWALILILALLVFGGRKLPRLAKELWESMQQPNQEWQFTNQAPIRYLNRRMRMLYLLETATFIAITVLLVVRAITFEQAAILALVFTAWISFGIFCFVKRD